MYTYALTLKVGPKLPKPYYVLTFSQGMHPRRFDQDLRVSIPDRVRQGQFVQSKCTYSSSRLNAHSMCPLFPENRKSIP